MPVAYFSCCLSIKGQTMNVFLMQNEMQGCTASGKKLLRKSGLKSLSLSLSLMRTDIFYKVQLSSSSVQLRSAPEPSWAGREVWWPLRVWCFPAERHQTWVTSGEMRSPHTLLSCRMNYTVPSSLSVIQLHGTPVTVTTS